MVPVVIVVCGDTGDLVSEVVGEGDDFVFVFCGGECTEVVNDLLQGLWIGGVYFAAVDLDLSRLDDFQHEAAYTSFLIPRFDHDGVFLFLGGCYWLWSGFYLGLLRCRGAQPWGRVT